MANKWLLPALLALGAGVAAYELTKKPAGAAPPPPGGGETPGAIEAAKTRLTQLGYYTGPIDSNADQAFRDAVWGFQFDNNLPQTGVLDLATAQAMVGAGGGSAQPVQGIGSGPAVGPNGRRYAARF